MSDDAGQNTGDAADAGQQQGTGDTGDAGQTGETKHFTEAEVQQIVQSRIAAERKKIGDVGELRRKASEFDKLQEASKTELEKERDRAAKAEQKAADLEQRLRQREVRDTVTTAALRLGFHDPEDAWRLLDSDALELDEDGEPKNVEPLLKKLAERKPHLVKANGSGSADFGPRGNGASNSGDMNALIRRGAGRR